MKRLAIVDLSSVYWRNWHATKNEPVSEAHDLTVAKVHEIAARYDACVLALDPGGKLKRHEIYPEYKANRTEKDAASVAELQRCLERLVKRDGFLAFSTPGYEADDVIGELVHLACTCGDVEVDVWSGDKDLLQIVGCRFFDPVTGAERGEPPVVRGSFADYLALVGDSSDNYPGVEGIGPKAAQGIIETWGGIDDAYQSWKEGDRNKFFGTARGENFIAAVESGHMDTMRKLARLMDVDLTVDWNAVFAPRQVSPLIEEEEFMSDEQEAIEGEYAEAPQNKPAPEAAPQQEVTAIAVRPVGDMRLQPRSIVDVGPLAKSLLNSRLWQKFSSAEQIAAVIIRGSELGLGSTTSLDSFHMIKGVPRPAAHLMVALAKRHPDCEYIGCKEASAQSCTWVAKRRGTPFEESLTYTMEEAIAAGLGSNDNYKKNPGDMLSARASSKLVRRVFPDAVIGVYSREEMDGAE